MPKARSPLSIIFITIFIDLLGFGLIIPALPFYAESYGATPLEVGLLSMSYSLMQFIFAPMWGRISDRVGRRPIILMSLAGSCIAFVLFGMAHSLTMLFVARSLAGLLSSASLPTAQAFIADSTTPENRAKGMGLIGAAFGLGFIFGPALGGLLTKYGYAAPSYVAAVLAGGNWIWAYFSLPESLHHRPERVRSSYMSPAHLKETFGVPRLAFILAVYFLGVFAFSNMESTFALFCEHQIGLHAIGVGALLGEVGVISVIIQGFLIGKLSRRFGEIKLTFWGLGIEALGFMLTVFIYSTQGMIMVLPLYAIGSGVLNPSISALLSRAAPEDRQGDVLGVGQGIAALGRVLGPVWGTWLFQAFAPGAPYVSAAVLMALIALACAFYLRPLMQPVLSTPQRTVESHVS